MRSGIICNYCFDTIRSSFTIVHVRGCTPTAVRPPRFPSKKLTSRPHFSKGARRGVCHYYYHYSSSATSTQRQQAHRRAGFRGCSRPQLNLFTPSSLSSLITSYYLIYMPWQSDNGTRSSRITINTLFSLSTCCCLTARRQEIMSLISS